MVYACCVTGISAFEGSSWGPLEVPGFCPLLVAFAGLVFTAQRSRFRGTMPKQLLVVVIYTNTHLCQGDEG